MNRIRSAQRGSNQLPKKWAVVLVTALIFYMLVQPFANDRWGWKLPSLAGMLGNQSPVIERPLPNGAGDQKAPSETEVVEKDERQSASNNSESDSAELPIVQSRANSTATKNSDSPAGTNATDANLLYGLLKDVGREVYISPTGLRYTRGSEEGHRLKHIEKHLKDIPDRPGKHGVFDGDMAQVLRWIDDAYARGKRGAKDVRKRDEGGRTVYEAPFTKPIGYIGGRDGKRDNNPDAKRLRLVVDGDQVITAFPF